MLGDIACFDPIEIANEITAFHPAPVKSTRRLRTRCWCAIAVLAIRCEDSAGDPCSQWLM